jgi:hypothetical protein
MSDNQYKPYPDSGSLRASQTKKGPKSPDYWGNIAINLKDLTNIQTIDGLTVVKISGWKKQDKQGKTYLSLAVDRFVPEQRSTSKPARQDDDLDNVPF